MQPSTDIPRLRVGGLLKCCENTVVHGIQCSQSQHQHPLLFMLIPAPPPHRRNLRFTAFTVGASHLGWKSQMQTKHSSKCLVRGLACVILNTSCFSFPTALQRTENIRSAQPQGGSQGVETRHLYCHPQSQIFVLVLPSPVVQSPNQNSFRERIAKHR